MRSYITSYIIDLYNLYNYDIQHLCVLNWKICKIYMCKIINSNNKVD